MEAFTLTDGTPRAHLDVRFRSCWEVIDDTRDYLAQALGRAIADPARIAQIGVAAHELMENAYRYSSRPEIAIRVEVTGDVVRVITDNRASEAQLAALRREIVELREASDALSHYRRRMLESLDRDDGSGLGLARIQWEAEMALDFQIDGESVRVIASGLLTQ
jgi:hypothetical protein